MRKQKVGKRIGGDILEQKKTYLWNEMWANLDEVGRQKVEGAYKLHEEETIVFIKSLMIETEADKSTLSLATKYMNKSSDLLEQLNCPNDKGFINEILELLSNRES